jgi:hypothetical protein
MSLAYPDRAGPLSTCPGKFPENVRVPCPRVQGSFALEILKWLARAVWYGAYNLKNLGIKTPKLVLFELGTTAVCTLEYSSTQDTIYLSRL